MKEKLIIAGGSGFLGQLLIPYFTTKYDIVILTRGKTKLHDMVRHVHWDATHLGTWTTELEGAALLVNLTGKAVDCRYTKKNKAEILHSRIASTQVLNKAIVQCKNPPKHYINSSTATIYNDSRSKQMTEKNGDIGSDFSMTVGKEWERAFFDTETPHTLKTAIRTSFVLGANGGALPTLKLLNKLGFGGKQGDGQQFISWIHEADFARALYFIVQKKITGVLNLTTPHPVTNSYFMQALRNASGTSFGLTIPKPLVRLGAFILCTEPELILKSRNVYPEALLEQQFTFKYPTLNTALNELLCPSI